MKKIVITLATLLVASGSMAAMIFSDDFSDGNRDGWYLVNASASNSLPAETVDGQSVMSMRETDTTPDYYGAVTTFAAQDLSVAGSKLTLTMNFYNDTRWPRGRAMTAGLFNSNGTAITGDTTAAGDGWGNASDDSGIYGVAQRYTDRFTIRENISEGIDGNSGSDVTARSNNEAYGEAGLWFGYSLEIENIGGDLQTTVIFSGSDVAGQESVTQSYLDTAVANYTFDEIAFSARGNVNYSVDNVMVEYAIPEPATLGLVAAFGGGILFIRRRFMI